MLVALLFPDAPEEQLDGIGQAFFAALDRDGGPAVTLAAGLLAAALFLFLVRWVRREVARERREQELLDARHRAALAAAESHAEGREWRRVAARVPVTLRHTDARHQVVREECLTRNLSGGGGAVASLRPPPPGREVELSLDLGESRPLSLRGVVVRVDPPRAPGAPSIVGVKLGPIAPRDREHLARWVAREDAHEVAQARRGKLCPRCGRPVEAGAAMHEACGPSKSGRPRAPGSDSLAPGAASAPTG